MWLGKKETHPRRLDGTFRVFCFCVLLERTKHTRERLGKLGNLAWLSEGVRLTGGMLGLELEAFNSLTAAAIWSLFMGSGTRAVDPSENIFLVFVVKLS